MGGRRRVDPRWVVLSAIGLGAAVSWAYLGLSPAEAVPSRGGLAIALRFFAAAFSPAFDYEDPTLGESATPFVVGALSDAWRTLAFAAAAVSLSVVAAIPLGFLASSAWWAGDPAGGESAVRRFISRTFGPLVLIATRGLITVLRSIHELLWAVLFLNAFGLTPLSAVLAITLPYTGTLAKIYAEMIDEAPRAAAVALRSAGASPTAVFTFGLLPRALPDMAAYSFYRFECGIRSSAVLGFFGLPTLGLSIKQSFENLYYGEVWTYLYLLFGMVVAIEAWSGAMRRRMAT